MKHEPDLERLEGDFDHPHWKSPRDVPAPEGMIEMPLGDPFEAYLGPFFINPDWRSLDLEAGDELKVAFKIDDRHVNARGICHGGMFMTFADATLGIVSWFVADKPTVTLSLQSNFLKPGHLGDWVITRPKLIRKTASIIFVESTLEVEEEPIFTCSSLWKVVGR